MTPRRSSLPEQTHNQLKAQILAYLQQCGAFPIPVNSGAWKVGNRYVKFSVPGCSDILCCWQGKFVAVEIKVKRDALRDSQIQFLDHVRHAGGVVIVARTLEDVIAAKPA